MPRYFSYDEANALIPTLRPLLQEMADARARLREIEGHLGGVVTRARGNGHASESGVQEEEKRGRALASRLQELVNRVQAEGIEVKDLERGLIDFWHRKDGEDVYLCWMLGEDDIAWWHPIDTGFAGRQPL